jgi:hypothetical protein
MSPVYLLWSVPPNINSPFLTDDVVVGSKDTETILDAMVPWLKRLSVIVGIVLFTAGDSVPMVRSTGPILQKRRQRKFVWEDVHANPRTPSKPSKPNDSDATPIDWRGITRPGAIVTVSMNSVPGGVNKAKPEMRVENPPLNVPWSYAIN